MKAAEAKVLIDAIQGLIEKDGPKPDLSQFDRTAPRLVKKTDGVPPGGTADWTAEQELELFERFYQKVKARLLEELPVDPVLLHLIAARPEIIIDVEPRRQNIDGSSLKGRIARLMAAGFFSEGRKQNQVRVELTRTGSEPNSGGLSTAMNDNVKDGFLVRDGDLYTLAPNVKITERELVAK